jgi:hypothetical protein
MEGSMDKQQDEKPELLVVAAHFVGENEDPLQ